jgi:hypothetical protein
MLFNSTRVISTPDASLAGGGLTPVAGSTVKPIGFGLVGLFGRPLEKFGKFGLNAEKGIPAVLKLPCVDVVLNGAQPGPPEVDEPLKHTSIGWTLM